MRLLRRLWYLVRQRRLDADLAEELAFHRERTQQDLERQGLPSADAVVEARRRLGNTLLARDDARDVWGWTWLHDIILDARLAVRVLASDPRFTAAAVLALGLGIGVTNSVFTVINTALIRDVPFEDPDRLLDLGVVNRDGREVGLSYADYLDWSRAKSLEGIGVSMFAVMNVSDRGQAPERLRGTYVSVNTFDLLRARPLLGRGFRAEDGRPGSQPVVVIGYGVWQDRYGGDPAVVGRTVRINGIPTNVVGVMERGFRYPFVNEAWQPLSLAPSLPRDRRDARPFRNIIARLAAGADLPLARTELEALAANLGQAHPETNNDLRPALQLMTDSLPGHQIRPILMTFLGAVTFVLLIACANVSNLLLARAATRAREMAIRASLGATRWRIARQLIIECLVLAILAGVVGTGLSISGAKAIAVGFSPIEPGADPGELMPFWVDLGIDATVVAFIATACVLSTLVFGLVPALQAARVDVNGVLKDGGRGVSVAPAARRWTSVFIVAEVALTVVLLAGAGLLWRSFLVKYRTDLVVDASGLVTTQLTLPLEQFDTPEKRRDFFQRLEARLAGVSALTGVTIASHMPLLPGGAPRHLLIDGAPPSTADTLPTVSYVLTGTNYFETLKIRPLRGRVLDSVDGFAGREGAVVDERLATRFFPGGDALGRRIRVRAPDAPEGNTSPWLTIVGVIPAPPDFGPPSLSHPVVYAPMQVEPSPGQGASVVARGRDVAAVASVLREQVRAIDPDLPLYAIETLDAVAARSRSPQRLVGTWFGVIALIALVLSTVGVYALTAYGVAQRTQEIGIRMALGAQASHVTWLFLRRTAAHLAIGLALGLLGALAAGQLLRTFLVDTHPRDPLTLAGVVMLLALVGLAACLIPARRAVLLDPVAALRCE